MRPVQAEMRPVQAEAVQLKPRASSSIILGLGSPSRRVRPVQAEMRPVQAVMASTRLMGCMVDTAAKDKDKASDAARDQ